MGQGPPWSPVVPSKAGSRSVLMACLHACLAPVWITAGGLACLTPKDFKSKLKLRGSTFLRILPTISKTMRSEFFRRRWQAIHSHTDSQLRNVGAMVCVGGCGDGWVCA